MRKPEQVRDAMRVKCGRVGAEWRASGGIGGQIQVFGNGYWATELSAACGSHGRFCARYVDTWLYNLGMNIWNKQGPSNQQLVLPVQKRRPSVVFNLAYQVLVPTLEDGEGDRCIWPGKSESVDYSDSDE